MPMTRSEYAKRALTLLTIGFAVACGSSEPSTSTSIAKETTGAELPVPAAPPSGADNTPPPADTTSPATGTTPPGTNTAPPGTGTTPPGTGTTPPGTGTTPPGTGTTPPGTGTTPPPAAPPPAAVVTPPVPVVTAPQPPTTAPSSLRGTNLVGMEGGYNFNQTSGPIPDTDYAVHSTQVVDYLAGKHVNMMRFLFSWEGMQSTLNGPIPAATSGNYKAYFDDYKRIVDYATNVKGMVVIIEPWQASSSGGVGGASWRGNVVGGGVVTNAHFADFWSKMAAVYASNPRVAIGLVNEPNGVNTMSWFGTAQAAITAIRDAGFKGDIHVPGNGWTGASSWSDTWYDTGSPARSNAYGWMNARGVGQPLLDPLGKLVVSVHTYADTDASGSTTGVVSTTISRERVTGVVDWARTNGLKVFVGEIGMYAGATNASGNWNDFVSYADANADTLLGYAWWACGKPGWWNDVAASGGGHFSITPTSGTSGDTVNMTMIQGGFH
jgi:endoglucanase